MTVSAKGRRRIEVDGHSYLWWVERDAEECDALMLSLVSDDRRLHVRYPLVQADELRHIIVVGPEFRGTDQGGPRRRFRCPAFGTFEMVTPKDVAALVRWCKTNDGALVRVDWNGLPVPEP
jgi:hypothetical protein